VLTPSRNECGADKKILNVTHGKASSYGEAFFVGSWSVKQVWSET